MHIINKKYDGKVQKKTNEALCVLCQCAAWDYVQTESQREATPVCGSVPVSTGSVRVCLQLCVR